MQLRSALLAVFLASAVPNVQAQQFDFSFSDESLAFEIHGPVRSAKVADLRYDLGFIYKDDYRNNTLGYFGLYKGIVNDAGLPGLTLGAGGHFYIGDIRSADVSALAPGLILGYVPAVEKRFGFTLLLDYAPSILTFADGEKLFKFDTRFSYEVIDNTRVYLGYRDIEVTIEENSKVHVDNGWVLGVELPL